MQNLQFINIKLFDFLKSTNILVTRVSSQMKRKLNCNYMCSNNSLCHHCIHWTESQIRCLTSEHRISPFFSFCIKPPACPIHRQHHWQSPRLVSFENVQKERNNYILKQCHEGFIYKKHIFLLNYDRTYAINGDHFCIHRCFFCKLHWYS